ncbi:anhydro-N-acetylmuramic acid kinase [Pseudonocardia sp. GCM10023141]|uniref:anhydro-N-acetylmuramic acid kinase n=1 Tax=Pseudonocardia sp. GCM10023141 TaxID=3252653 RepID=UPI003619DAD6
MRVIGLMSGTSYDAVDAAAADLHLDGTTLVLRPLGAIGVPHPADLRDRIAAVLPPAAVTAAALCRLDTEIGQVFAEVAARAVGELCGGRADLVVSHGQTIFHWVDAGQVRGTLQIGQPAWIAERTGLPVVADLRARDVAASGQGAPLVSAVDALLLAGRPGTPAALNLGGIANITVVPAAGPPLAFDTGPANALIDAVVTDRTGAAFDAGGTLAARGRVLPDLLERLLADPYYAAAPPKTTGKEHFHLPYLHAVLDGTEPRTDDLLATLTALTARTVADAIAPHGVTELIAAGGGTRNPTLMAALDAAIGPATLRISDELGLPAAAKEAYAFALLGFLTAHGLPATLPSCTGARGPRVLGAVVPGRTGFPRTADVTQPPQTLRIEVVDGPG